MVKTKITYDQKFESKFLMTFVISISTIVIIGVSIYCISEQIYKDDITSFLTLLFISIILSFFAFIPCIIIERYKFIIDLDNQILIFRDYFKRTVHCDLNDIKIRRKFVCNFYGDSAYPEYKVYIYCKGKKLCTISSSDFENKTKESLFAIFKENI
ncbi:MAG: hypothetical protein E7183_01835 [Erysipelotrichaceae bacterium]|nr:hypothetical protein [Erysipelotrichaceae bacterium]